MTAAVQWERHGAVGKRDRGISDRRDKTEIWGGRKLMDRKELIERLRADAEWAEGQEWEAPICLQDDILGAISVLTTLIDECKLLTRYASEKYSQCAALEKENDRLRAELEQAKRERDRLKCFRKEDQQ